MEVWTKCGRRGRVKEPVGTHGRVLSFLFEIFIGNQRDGNGSDLGRILDSPYSSLFIISIPAPVLIPIGFRFFISIPTPIGGSGTYTLYPNTLF